MKFQIASKPYVKVSKLPKIELTPRQKFERLVSKLDKKSKLRQFHFNLIPHGSKVVLFDGIGNELGFYSFSIEGIREARVYALTLFQEAKNQNGGYSVTAPAMDFLTYEEVELAKKQTSKLLAYNPFVHCSYCKFQFELDSELKNHRCGKDWAILEFRFLTQLV